MTNAEDALAAISYGADAVGFLVGQMHTSTSHFISATEAAEIIPKLPPYCSTVLVTHLSHPEEIREVASATQVSTIQLHGETTPDEAKEIRDLLPYIKMYKVIHVFDETAIDEAKRYEGSVDAIILDTAVKATGQVGGTGKTHDWNISQRLVEAVRLPVILAGGLNPENVVAAIEAVHPYAVDVNSGVTNKDGTKDHKKLKRFIENSKGIKTS